MSQVDQLQAIRSLLPIQDGLTAVKDASWHVGIHHGVCIGTVSPRAKWTPVEQRQKNKAEILQSNKRPGPGMFVRMSDEILQSYKQAAAQHVRKFVRQTLTILQTSYA